MSKIKSLLFKIYILFLVCFCTFIILFLVMYLKDIRFDDVFDLKERYNTNMYDGMIHRHTYFKEFDLNSKIENIFFKASHVDLSSEVFNSLDELKRENIIASYPSFTLRFTIVDKGRLMTFKDVIFDGVNAKFYNYKITKPEFTTSDEPYFQIITNDALDQKYLGEYPVRVVNKFVITFNEALFKVLREQVKLKITLVAHDDVEYVLETSNFLSEKHFNISH
ncbi:hypothetical protein [Borrelia coriaceae]|nr:hypothetical protein [Borrelia coriaceae]